MLLCFVGVKTWRENDVTPHSEHSHFFSSGWRRFRDLVGSIVPHVDEDDVVAVQVHINSKW